MSYQSLNVVNVWAFNNLSKPLYQLKDPSCSHVVSFDLRRCEPESSDYDVITCYKNKTLGLWKVPQHVRAKLLEPCDVNSVKVTKTQATSTTQQDELDSEFEQVYDSTKLSKFLSSADRAKRVCVLLWEGKPKQSSKAAERQQQQRNQQAQEDVSQDIYNTESSTSQQFNGTLYQVKVKVSFPSIYPKAIASFEIIRQITPNDTQESNAILGSLKKKAHECAIYGKGCLVSVIEELDRVCSKLVETVKVPLPAPTQPMPCPRFSGCCFSPSGEFVYFVQSRGTRMEKCPRTYQDFLEQIKNPQNLPQSKFSIKPNSKNSSGAGSGGGNSGTSSCDGSGIFSGTHGTKPPGAGTSSDPNSGKNSFSSRPGASVSDGSSSDVCSSAEDNNSKMTYYKAAALYYSQQQMFQPDAVQENVNRSPLPDFASTVTQVNEKRAEVNPVHFVSSVWRTCFDFIMPFSPELARGYVLRGSSVKEVCRANEAVARRLGRMDLASMWSILSLLLDPEANTDKGKRSMLNFNWIRRPIGMKMVEEVFNKAISNKDVQTLGILACVLILYSKETNMQNIPVRDTKPGDSSQHEVEPNVSSSRGMVSPTLMSATPTTAPSFGPNSHDGYPLLSPISLRGFAPSSKLSHSPLSSSPVDGTRQQMPSLALREGASHSKRPSRTNCTVNNPALGGSIGCIHVARKVPINKSMDGGGCTGVSPTNSGVYINKSQMEGRPLKLLLSNASVSSEPLQKQGPHIFLEEYPRFMHSYATLLYKWGLFYEMKMIHDFIDLYNEMYSKYGSFSPRQDPQARSCLSSSSSSSFPSISSSLSSSLPVKEIGPYSVVIKRDPVCLCFNCKTPCSSYACPNCARIVLRCSICHSSVKGLSWYCTSCLHGGHLGHMSKWFEDNEVCPTGCGCRCKENAYKQDTSEGSFPMENLPFEDVRPSVPTNSSQQTQTETGSPTLANSLTTLVSSELQQ